MDQSGEDCGIIGGEVEGTRVCFLQDEDMLGYRKDSVMWRQKSCSYLELSTEELAKVLRLDPEDGLVDLPLFVATCDGEIGEETFWQETIAALADDQICSERRWIYFLILVMASWDILADLRAGAVQLCW